MARESAFSLIEVLIALVLVSMSTMALNKVLLARCYYMRDSMMDQSITLLLWSMVDALRYVEQGSEETEIVAYWRQQLKAVDPHSDLMVQRLKVENRWVYTIQVRWGLGSRRDVIQQLVEAAVL